MPPSRASTKCALLQYYAVRNRIRRAFEADAPDSHPTLISQIAWGRITVKPGVEHVDGHDIRFTDGSTERFDAIIAATRYTTALPFLADDFSPAEPGSTHINLYNRVAHPTLDGLYFIGLFNVIGGSNIRMMDDQAKYITAMATGKVKRPGETEMHASIATDRTRMATQFLDSLRYGLELDPRRYRKRLAMHYAANGIKARPSVSQNMPGYQQ
jgi:hypothetical protein